MTMVALEGVGVWMPSWVGYMQNTPLTVVTDTPLLDADEEEVQFIGQVTIDGGGSKTFGTSSKIGWHVGAATITFATGATLRVGVKQASKIDTATGPPARATIGAAAFDVWDDLVGGTDTLTAATWREETMTAGTPFTVTNGDFLAVCLHLDVTSGTPALKMRHMSANTGAGQTNSLLVTLVTSGPTYTAQLILANVVIVFNDGTLGWFESTKIFVGTTDVTTGAIGSGNSFANIVQVPFTCQVDALAAVVTTGAGTGDCALELLGTPLGTPTVLATVPIDANVTSSTALRPVVKRVVPAQTLTANTPYAVSLKQTTANAVLGAYFDVPTTAAYFKPQGMGANCYAANSTGGATFVSQNSGRRRYHIWMRVSAVDDGAGAGLLRKSDLKRQRTLRFAQGAR